MPRQTFLAELYLPPSDGALERTIDRARGAATEATINQTPARFVDAIFAPGDEICFLVFEADSVEVVLRLGLSAGLSFARVVEAIR